MAIWQARLLELGLVRTGETALPARLSMACDDGRLVGGLSVALDVRPDELLGPLLQHMGGRASSLKILDVRDVESAIELTLEHEGYVETWHIQDVPALIARLNALYRADDEVKRVLVLGEWNDALQLWCVPRPVLEELAHEEWWAHVGGMPGSV